MNVLIKREQSERAHFAKQEKGGMKFKFKFKIQQYQTDWGLAPSTSRWKQVRERPTSISRRCLS